MVILDREVPLTPLLCFQDRYCIISSLDSHIYREHGRQGAGGGGGVTEKCYYCHAADPELSHNVTNIIHRYHGNSLKRPQFYTT